MVYMSVYEHILHWNLFEPTTQQYCLRYPTTTKQHSNTHPISLSLAYLFPLFTSFDAKNDDEADLVPNDDSPEANHELHRSSSVFNPSGSKPILFWCFKSSTMLQVRRLVTIHFTFNISQLRTFSWMVSKSLVLFSTNLYALHALVTYI